MLKLFKLEYFLGKNPWNIEINPYLFTVFFIVLDLRLTKVWVTAVTLFYVLLLLILLSSKQKTISFHQFPDEEKGVDGYKAVAD